VTAKEEPNLCLPTTTVDDPGVPLGSPCPSAQAAMQTIPALTFDDAHPTRLTGPAAGTTSWLLRFQNAPKCVDALAWLLHAGGDLIQSWPGWPLARSSSVELHSKYGNRNYSGS
jgi:hypothetical protein